MDEVDQVLKEIEGLKDSENYRKLFEVIKSDSVEGENCSKWGMKQPRAVLEDTLLKKGFFGHLLSRDTIKYVHKVELLSLILYLYYSQKSEKLLLEDIKKIFNIYERVLLYAEDFDRYIETPAPTQGFYEKLKKVKWSNEAREVKEKIFSKWEDVTCEAFRNGRGKGINKLWTIEFALNYISASRAVNQGRDEILAIDVIKSWETYLKLIFTDITKIGVAVDKTDEELDKEFEKLGTYKGVAYKDILNKMREDGVVE